MEGVVVVVVVVVVHWVGAVVVVGIGVCHASIITSSSITSSSITSSTITITSTTLDQMNGLIRINNPIFFTTKVIIIQNPPFMNQPLPLSRTITGMYIIGYKMFELCDCGGCVGGDCEFVSG